MIYLRFWCCNHISGKFYYIFPDYNECGSLPWTCLWTKHAWGFTDTFKGAIITFMEHTRGGFKTVPAWIRQEFLSMSHQTKRIIHNFSRHILTGNRLQTNGRTANWGNIDADYNITPFGKQGGFRVRIEKCPIFFDSAWCHFTPRRYNQH